MEQIKSIVNQAIDIMRLAVRLLLAIIVLVIAAQLVGIRIPWVRVSDANLQATAAFLAAAAYAMGR